MSPSRPLGCIVDVNWPTETPLLGRDLAGVAARLGVAPGRLDAALDAVGGGRRVSLRAGGRRHCVTDVVASELGIPSRDLAAALEARPPRRQRGG
jgi:hypothetical protein